MTNQVGLEERLIREKPRKNKIIECSSTDTIKNKQGQRLKKRDKEYSENYLNGREQAMVYEV